MRRVLVDSRGYTSVNWSTSPQSEDPLGWSSYGEYVGGEYVYYSDRDYLTGTQAGLGLPARRVVRYTRKAGPFSQWLIDEPSIGVYARPDSGPWVAAIPESQDGPGVMNVSVYARVSKDSNVALVRHALGVADTISGPDNALPAGVWTRVNYTFPTSVDGNRNFSVTLRAVPYESPVAGDTLMATRAMFRVGPDVADYFDGGSPSSWWNLRSGRDTPTDYWDRGPGQVESIVYGLRN